MMNKLVLSLLVGFCVFGFCLGSVSAGDDGDGGKLAPDPCNTTMTIWTHTYGKGAVGLHYSWNSPNGYGVMMI
jgi:hypothetical protein